MSLHRLIPLTLIPFCVGLLFSIGCGGNQSSAKRINAGGATFVDPIMQKWAAVYRQNTGVEIDYVKKGSGYGIQQMTARNLDFGCSDAPMLKEELEKAKAENGDVIHIPVTMGAVAVVYNLPEIKEQLKLSGKVIADIYLRNITKWNDKAIAELNPGLALPDKEISPVFRAESSGTTNIFTEFLAKSNPTFREKIGISKKPKWPQGGIGQEGSDGVTGHVKSTPYCIGYVEVLYAKKNDVKYALLKNRKGALVGPEADNVTAAAKAVIGQKPTEEPYSLHELTYSITDVDDEKAYPIAGISYAIFYAKQPKNKGTVIVNFLKWAVTDGQIYAKEMEFSPLPTELAAKIIARLEQVTFE